MRRRALSRSTVLLAAAALAPLGLAGCMETATYGTGEMPEVAMIREVSGGLLKGRHKKPQIDYQPRAPLVMPPSGEALPPPAETAQAADPNWPVDPNEHTLASATADDGNPMNDINQAEYRRLRPLAAVMPGTTFDSREAHSGKDDYYTNIVHGGRQQRQQFRQALAEANGIGSSTTRRYLTEPPLEYRQPAPTAAADYEDIKKKKKPGFFSRLFGAS